MEQTKKTNEGEKRSAMVKTAKNKVPAIKPNCTALVRLAKKLTSTLNCLIISGKIAFPANHKDVQKNWEITITGKIRLMTLYIDQYIFHWWTSVYKSGLA